MPIRVDILSQLADVLAELYYTQGSIETMATTAGLNLAQISFYPRAIDTWVLLLEEAEIQHRAPAILERARTEKPFYEPLLSACQAYTDWVTAGRPMASPLYIQAVTMHVPPPDAGSFSSHRAGPVNYDLGFVQLESCLKTQYPNLLPTLATLKDRYLSNQKRERVLGRTSETRSEHNEVIYALNELALENCATSFTDLCGGTSKSNSIPELSPPSGTFAAERANHLRGLITQCQLHLEALEKQQVAFGIHTPHDIVVEIENTQSEMTKWAEELARLELSHETNTRYDVAILCHEHDHNLVEIIALRLRNHSLNVWFEPWDRIPGSRIEDQLGHQIGLAPVCAIVVGPATPETWLVKAIELALNHQKGAEKYRLLPVLLPQCTDSVIARYPSIREWSDFRDDIQDDWAFHVLIQSVKGFPVGPRSVQPTSTTVDISQYKQQLSAIRSIADEGLIEPEVKIAAQHKIVNQILLSWA